MSTADDSGDETAMSLALKRAAGAKLKKKLAKRDKRKADKEARLDRLKVKAPDPQDQPPAAIPAPQTGAAMQVSAQHFLQEKAAREKRIQQLASIALGRTKAPEPVVIERLPPPPPSGPDDPRILNGTLAPSPKVAEILKTMVSEVAVEAAKPKRDERTGPPEAWLEILRTGTPSQILATRPFKNLKGDDREAFDRARKRELDAILAGRRFADLSPEEKRDLYVTKTRHMKLMTDLTAPRKRRKGAARSVAGKAIDRLRHKAGLTLVQTASGAGLTGNQLRDIVSGRRPATLDEAALLARFFHAKPEIFIVSTPAPIPAAKAPAPTLNGVTPPKTNPKRPGYNPEVALRQLTETTEPRDTDTFFQASLRRIMRSRGLMGLHVARLCGLTLDLPSRLLRDGSIPRPETREKLLAGLGVTEEELFGPATDTPEPKALQAAPEARLAAPAPEAVPEADPDRSAALVAPTVPVEMGVPMPVIVLRSDRYPWDMPKGGSFKAEVPFGMPWATFRSRFLKMIDRQSESLGHWYTFEENEAEGLIRVWRYI